MYEELSKCLSESISKTKFEIAKQIIKEYYYKATYGIFDCRGWAKDAMYTIYHDGELTINICYNYEFFEVFGLSAHEFIKLKRFYEELGEET